MPDNLLNKALRRLLIAAMLTAGAAAQPVANDRQPLAEEVFKNVQVLKGISVTEFMDTMGFFSAALGLNCTGCHVYGTYHVKVPLEIYAKAPNQRKMVYHTQNGDSISVFDGQKGWLAAVDRPLPLLALLPGAELDAAKLDADLCFPGGIVRALNRGRSDFR